MAIVRLNPRKTAFRVFVAIVLALGIYFRFVNLDLKVYWVDETFTSLRIAGYTMADFAQQTLDGPVLSWEELHRFQRPSPEKTVGDTVKALATEAPEHPPLYYILVRSWVRFWGNSVAIARSFSAVASTLSFPAIYGLCWELFEARADRECPIVRNPVGWMAMVLIAISPLHVLYAQEAREYTLWIVMVLLSSATFLRAIRLNTVLDWGLYAIAMVAGLYTYPLTALVAFSHGLYLAILERFRFNKTSIFYLLSSVAAILAFLPWLLVLKHNFTPAAWRSEWVSPISLITGWLVNLGRVFIDLSPHVENPMLGFLILALVAYSIYLLIRTTELRVWLFLLLLIGVTSCTLIVPDLVSGGVRSLTIRYLIPSYLGIQIAVAFGLTVCIPIVSNGFSPSFSSLLYERDRDRKWVLFKKKGGLFLNTVFSMVFLMGVLSIWISSNSQIWWNKDYYTSLYNLQAAQSIDREQNSLVVSDNYTIVSLSYLLANRTNFKLMQSANPSVVPSSFNTIFLYNSSPELKSRFLERPHYQNQNNDNPLLLQLKVRK